MVECMALSSRSLLLLPLPEPGGTWGNLGALRLGAGQGLQTLAVSTRSPPNKHPHTNMGLCQRLQTNPQALHSEGLPRLTSFRPSPCSLHPLVTPLPLSPGPRRGQALSPLKASLPFPPCGFSLHPRRPLAWPTLLGSGEQPPPSRDSRSFYMMGQPGPRYQESPNALNSV